MKKLLLIAVLVLSSFVVRAQSNVKFSFEKVRDFDYTTKTWSAEIVLEQVSYVQYVAGQYIHVHLPDLDIDFTGKILAEKSYEESGNAIYIYDISISKESNDKILAVKFLQRKSGSVEVYLTITGKASLAFDVTDITDLSNTVSN